MKGWVGALATLLVISALSFGGIEDTSTEFKTERELRFVSDDGAIHTHSGHLEIKMKGGQDYAILPNGTVVLEIPLNRIPADAASFRSEFESKITLLNRFPDDLSDPVAWVSTREHSHDLDALDDANLKVHTLVRIESDGKRLHDRSFCSVHQVPMELRNVGVQFGMLTFSAAERYCQEYFPHCRDFGMGGCTIPEGEEYKTVPIYICATCVMACQEYKADHPEPKQIDRFNLETRRPCRIRSKPARFHHEETCSPRPREFAVVRPGRGWFT